MDFQADVVNRAHVLLSAKRRLSSGENFGYMADFKQRHEGMVAEDANRFSRS
jgi:hypothetical protein